MSLVIVSTHPIQYQAPVYRAVQQNFGIPVTVIYGSDFSIKGYKDREFDTTFAWDTDLLSGYASIFLSRIEQGKGSKERDSQGGISKILRSINPQAVMILGYSPCFHQKAFCLAWRAGYPILFRGETTDHAHRRNPLAAWMRDRVLRWMYKRCFRLLYVGRHSYQHYKRLRCPEEKLIFSPYCVDTEPFQCDEEARLCLRGGIRQQLGVDENDRVLLFSGKLSSRKGVELLLEAVKHLPQHIRESVTVMLLGSGKLKSVFQDFAQNPPTVKLHFIGFKNQSELSGYYHAADVLALPSKHSETWGLVVNEALHHGLPAVVSSAVGCAPDLIEPGLTGEIFQTGSMESLKEALQKIFARVGSLQMRQHCRTKIENYTVEKAAEGIAQAYKDAVGSSLK
ncbi:MAG: glycosyltransferase family 4 protein [Candidatus Omnitrophota bacterium]|nr:MAG: glycosyltransferase family 4 protein [Candidatus Omnitrophota bacterium]